MGEGTDRHAGAGTVALDAAPAIERTRPLRVVVADDCLESRVLLRVTLESAGYEVVGEAIDGLGAIEVAHEKRPDVILLDFMMPLVSGVEAIESIRAGSPECKVVVLSAMIQDQVHDRLAHTAPDAWLVKGSRPEEVVKTIAWVAGGGAPQPSFDGPDRAGRTADVTDQDERGRSALVEALTGTRPATGERRESGAGAVGIALLTTSGRFIRVNAAYEEMSGREAQTLTGTWPETLEPEDATRVASAVGQLGEGRIDRFESPIRFDRPDGRVRGAHARLSVLRNVAGLPLKLLVQVTDAPAEGGGDAAPNPETVATTTAATTSETPSTETQAPEAVAEPSPQPDPTPSRPAAKSAPHDHLDREQALRRAVVAGELIVRYQPVVDLHSRRIIGTEALVRWDHPLAGVLRPRDFLPLAADIDVMGPIGRMVVESACEQAQNWCESYPELDLVMSVNLSAPELADDRFCEFVEASLDSASLPAERLAVEVAERALVGAGSSAVATLTRLHEMGVQITVDDFGGSYSSRVQQIPISMFKIDRSFLNGLGGTDMAETVMGSIVRVARAVHAKTVAKGIDRPDQGGTAARLGCDAGQGVFFGGPDDPEVIDRLLAESVTQVTQRAGSAPRF